MWRTPEDRELALSKFRNTDLANISSTLLLQLLKHGRLLYNYTTYQHNLPYNGTVNRNTSNMVYQPPWYTNPPGIMVAPPETSGASDMCFKLIDVLDYFHSYYIPFIIFIGILGNILSCIVFLSTHLKMRSSSYYLAALASADLGFLATLFMVWLSNNDGVQLFNKNGWCQCVVYISSVSSFLSVWLIVAFTVERFIAVQYPLHRPHMCTVARAKMIVISLTLFSLILHSYSFVTAGIIQHDDMDTCDLLHEYHDTMRIINTIDSIFTLILPLILIIIMNTMITKNLIKFSRRFKSDSTTDDASEQASNSMQMTVNSRRHQGSQQSLHSLKSNNSRITGRIALPIEFRATQPSCSGRTSPRTVVSARTQQSITKMLLLISTVFVLLNLPSYVIRLYVFVFYSLWEQTAPPSLWCMQQFFMLLYYTNFSINFLLYSMCGITFRRCLSQLLRSKLRAMAPSRCIPQRLL